MDKTCFVDDIFSPIRFDSTVDSSASDLTSFTFQKDTEPEATNVDKKKRTSDKKNCDVPREQRNKDKKDFKYLDDVLSPIHFDPSVTDDSRLSIDQYNTAPQVPSKGNARKTVDLIQCPLVEKKKGSSSSQKLKENVENSKVSKNVEGKKKNSRKRNSSLESQNSDKVKNSFQNEAEENLNLHIAENKSGNGKKDKYLHSVSEKQEIVGGLPTEDCLSRNNLKKYPSNYITIRNKQDTQSNSGVVKQEKDTKSQIKSSSKIVSTISLHKEHYLNTDIVVPQSCNEEISKDSRNNKKSLRNKKITIDSASQTEESREEISETSKEELVAKIDKLMKEIKVIDLNSLSRHKDEAPSLEKIIHRSVSMEFDSLRQMFYLQHMSLFKHLNKTMEELKEQNSATNACLAIIEQLYVENQQLKKALSTRL
ncbi:uncharacterized protein LOC118204840 [Stegodyphus dumicola]|uniref:uncharacterized protein LOC118204840 n=1 Tax=Stegodyphus dumicola TaxID=202533 RepID=UPI0015A9BDB1|nr:uncharacterized protein LOC118204840 [Stegodyphus dumicola]